jgi:small subunit ribosomal protein S3e
MKGWDPEGRLGPKKPLPDSVTIYEPPVDKLISEPVSEQRGGGPEQPQAPAPQQEEQQFEDAGFQAEQPQY